MEHGGREGCVVSHAAALVWIIKLTQSENEILIELHQLLTLGSCSAMISYMQFFKAIR